MAFTIPTVEPLELVAGDRAQWKRTDLDDFPSTEWTLTYYFRGSQAGSQIDIAATDSSGDYLVDVAPSVTATYIPGVYYWSAFVSKSGDRKLVAQGRLTVKVNPVDVTQPTDGRSHARRTLDAIDAVIEGRATKDIQRYVFQAVGRSVDKMPIADLLKLRDYYAGLVRSEDEAASVARGEGTGRNILIRFS